MSAAAAAPSWRESALPAQAPELLGTRAAHRHARAVEQLRFQVSPGVAPEATANTTYGRGSANADITVSTSPDQVPLAPGNKVSDVVRGGRRTARFVSGVPVHPRFSVQSARYAERHRRHGGVDLAVYYHPAHAWNVERMLDALAAALDYYQANFLRTLLERYRFRGAPYPRSLDLVAALRAEAKTPEEQALITDLFERVTLYHLQVTGPTAVRRPDGRWNVTVPVEAKKFYADGKGVETETRLAERIEIGLFTAEPGRDAFDASHVVLLERHPIRSGRQVLRFVTDRRPTYAGIDPYNFYIDRNSADNVLPVR
jgi:hypothetical protein